LTHGLQDTSEDPCERPFKEAHLTLMKTLILWPALVLVLSGGRFEAPVIPEKAGIPRRIGRRYRANLRTNGRLCSPRGIWRYEL
jgi:hypothetical protein